MRTRCNKISRNQRIAYELVHSRIVRIPRVYAFFTNERGCGYLVIEFIERRIIEPLEESDVVPKIAGVLGYFATLRYTRFSFLKALPRASLSRNGRPGL